MWSSFGWPIKRNFSEGPALGIAPFQKIQREVIYFLYVVRKKMKSHHKLSKILNIRKKQYPWCLKLKFLGLVWFGNRSGKGERGLRGMVNLPPPPIPLATPLCIQQRRLFINWKIFYKLANKGNWMKTRWRNAMKFVRPISKSSH